MLSASYIGMHYQLFLNKTEEEKRKANKYWSTLILAESSLGKAFSICAILMLTDT